MTLRIVGSGRPATAVGSGNLAHTVQQLSSGLNFKSVLSTAGRLADATDAPAVTNQKLLQDAHRAQVAIGDLMAARRSVNALHSLFEQLAGTDGAVLDEIKKYLSNPPQQKIVSLFGDNSELYKKAWAELGLCNEQADSEKALSIITKLEESIECAMRHHEQQLLDVVISRANIAASAPDTTQALALRNAVRLAGGVA